MSDFLYPVRASMNAAAMEHAQGYADGDVTAEVAVHDRARASPAYAAATVAALYAMERRAAAGRLIAWLALSESDGFEIVLPGREVVP
jgi:hypothetical protein